MMSLVEESKHKLVERGQTVSHYFTIRKVGSTFYLKALAKDMKRHYDEIGYFMSLKEIKRKVLFLEITKCIGDYN
jgi:hypothetical protein